MSDPVTLERDAVRLQQTVKALLDERDSLASQLEVAQEVIEAIYALAKAAMAGSTEHTPFLKWKYQDDHSH